MIVKSDNIQTVWDKICNLNWILICLIFILIVVGLVTLYSAAGAKLQPWALRQFYYFCVFFPLMIIIALTNTRLLFRFAYLPYFIAIILLIVVALMGHNSMGATRWIRIGTINIQPSEIIKLCLVIALAKYFDNMEAKNIDKTKSILAPIIIISLPALLILKQPDLGTTAILVLTGIIILYIAGVGIWKFITFGGLFLITSPFLWFFALYDYQKERIINFINPNNDPTGAGYNIIQSKIAIGSGGLTGKGLFNGTQGQLNFLPEKQTDFIFTMFVEELGFTGGFIVIAIYLAIILISMKIAIKTKHQFGRLLVIGIATIFFLHMFINISMVMGLMPVVGAPLPLISYGGTIMATMLTGFGLILNIDLNKDINFRN